MGQTGALCPQGQAEKALDPVSAIRGPHTRGRTENGSHFLQEGGDCLLLICLQQAGQRATHRSHEKRQWAGN